LELIMDNMTFLAEQLATFASRPDYEGNAMDRKRAKFPKTGKFHHDHPLSKIADTATEMARGSRDPEFHEDAARAHLAAAKSHYALQSSMYEPHRLTASRHAYVAKQLRAGKNPSQNYFAAKE
jgi:hypothetical protein